MIEASKGDVFQFPLKSIILEKNRTNKGSNGTTQQVTDEMTAMLDSTTEKLNNVNGVLELLPDLILAMEIRTSMILSPKDMMFHGLKLRIKNNPLVETPNSARILDMITAHISAKTDMEEDIPTYIDEALFKYGADIMMIIPPNALDQVISGSEFSAESIDDISEHFTDGNKVYTGSTFSIVDNINLLRRNETKKLLTSAGGSEVSMESYASAPIFKQRPMQRMFATKMDERVGADPIIFKIPMDACLHIHEPGNPKNHLSYIIPIDENGNIVSKMQEADYFGDLAERLETAVNAKSGEDYAQLKEMGLHTKDKGKAAVKRLNSIYVEETEKELIRGLREAGLADNVEVKDHPVFYKMMLSRALSKRKTKLLYVPEVFIDYMAFDYDSKGQGNSLLNKTQLYSSLRSVVMFSDLIRQMSNSIPQTDLNITLDEDDKSPYETIQLLLQEYGRVTDRGLPLGTFSPVSLMDELRRSGVRVNVDGGSKFPGTKLEREDRQRQIALVDDQLKEDLKKAQYAGLSVPAEAIDQTLQGDFAINTFTNNQLFVKRTMLDQYRFKKMLKRRIVKYIYLSGPLFEKIDKELKGKNIEDFLDTIEIQLPSADTAQIEQQMEAYDNYSDFIDKVMEAHISDSFLRGLVNADIAADTTEELRGMISAHFKREYLVRENILPELFDLQDKDNKDYITDKITDFNAVLLDTVGDIITKMAKKDAKLNNRITKTMDKISDGNFEDDKSSGDPIDDKGTPSLIENNNEDIVPPVEE